MLRPASTRWFEVLCPRSEGVRAVAELARTGAVEIEIRPHAEEDLPVADLGAGLARYAALSARYWRYWERHCLRRMPLVEPPAAVLERGLAWIDAWSVETDGLIDTLQQCEEELVRLRWLEGVLARIEHTALDFAALTAAGPVLGLACTHLPRDTELEFPDALIALDVPTDDALCFVILGEREQLAQFKQRVLALKGRFIERPPWLRGSAPDALRLVVERREFLASRVVHLYAEIDGLFDDYNLAEVLGELVWLEWFARQVGSIELASEHFVWVTGWTDDLSGSRLMSALDASKTRALLRFAPAPLGSRPPQVLDNPRWLKPFEFFVRALGVPDVGETDPTPVLAIVVPLLFGYMFGDVGQGLVLLLLGLSLRKRLDAAGMLMAGGLSSIGFGFLFGSVFSLENLIPALWLHPLHDPLSVLIVPLVFAVGLLSVGQILSGLGALWRGEFVRWLAIDAGFLLLYLGIMGMAAGLPAWPALAGLTWYVLGSLIVHRRLLGWLAAIGHLLEQGLQTLVNTLSFARVGAFALAHASLSAAVVAIAETGGSTIAWVLILVLGNALIILLEGLVVSIQTTRLVLFEFFNRCLRGTGRVFKPLPPPPIALSATPD